MTCTKDPCSCPDMYIRSDVSWRRGVLDLFCGLLSTAENILNAVISGATPSPTTAVFEPYSATAAGSIGAGYSVVEDLPDHTKSVNIANRTDGDVIVSMDGGTTDTYYLVATESIFIPLTNINLETSASIAIKQGTDIPTTGSLYIYSIH